MPATEKPPSDADSLKGSLLLAMPQMSDPRFDHAVVLMLEHSREGAMGLIINKPLAGIILDDLLEQLELPKVSGAPLEMPVLFGGPVEIGRGFILHDPGFTLAQSSPLGDGVMVTTMLEMLGHIATGKGPKDILFCLGYAGWGAGQLDDEIKQNTWLHAPLAPEILFQIPFEKRWDAAMALAGINPDFLADNAGHA